MRARLRDPLAHIAGVRRKAQRDAGGQRVERGLGGQCRHAQAADDDPPGRAREQIDGAREAIVEAGGERTQRRRLAAQHVAGNIEIGARVGEGD